MLSKIARNFARAQPKKPKLKLENLLGDLEDEIPDKDVRIVGKELRVDPASPEIDDLFIATMNLKIQILPEK